MKLGVTGTRHDLTREQEQAFCKWETHNRDFTELHQGCATGADTFVVSYYRLSADHCRPKIVGHPPKVKKWESQYARTNSDELWGEREYLDRNEDIARECDWLVAFPKAAEKDDSRSGTWATVRRARKHKRPITIFWPNGTVTEENTGSQ